MFTNMHIIPIFAVKSKSEDIMCGIVCAFDLKELQLRINKPLGIPMFLMFNNNMFSWYQKYSQLKKIPIFKSKECITIKKREEICKYILKSKMKNEKKKFWGNMNQDVNFRTKPSEIIIDKIIFDKSKLLGSCNDKI